MGVQVSERITPSDADVAQLRQAYEELKSKHELLLADLAAAQGAYAELTAKHELLLADYAAAQGAMARREHGAVPTAFGRWAEYRPWDDPL